MIGAQGGASHVVLAGGDNSEPAWSPDGASLAFTTCRSGETAQVFTVALDGSRLVDISHDTTVSEGNPDWTPDSTHIVFNSNRSHDCERENFEVNRNGTGLIQISAAAPSGSYAALSPDGRQLTMTLNDDGAIQISIETLGGVAGTGQVLTALQGTSVENLSWQPVVRAAAAAPNTITAGQPVTITTSGFGGRETVSFVLADSTGITTALGSTRTRSNGAATFTATVPASAHPGTATITATGAVTGRTAQTTTSIG